MLDARDVFLLKLLGADVIRVLLACCVGTSVFLGVGSSGFAQDKRKDPPPANAVVEKIDDGVVLITTQNALDRTTGTASGFVIDKSGLIATNYHVLRNAVRAYVQFRDGSKFKITGVRALAPERDLAILELADMPKSVEVIPLKDPGQLKQAEGLIAIGHPSGYKFTVTTGIVSAVRQTKDLPPEIQELLGSADDTEWVQSSAAISPGSSGGPLFNAFGDLVGVNAWIGGGRGIGFAVHVKHLIALKKQLTRTAQELPVPGLGLLTDPKVTALTDQYFRQIQQLSQQLQLLNSQEARNDLLNKQHPALSYADKFLQLAKQNKNSITGFEALYFASRFANTGFTKLEPKLEEILSQLERDYLQHPRMYEVAFYLGRSSRPYAIRFLKRLVKDAKSPIVKASSRTALAKAYTGTSRGYQPYYPEIRDLLTTFENEAADLKLGGVPLMDGWDGDLFYFKHLAIGAKAPEIQGKNHQGQPMALSDFQGKVTVLDFWANWCPFCQQMYEEERQLIKDFKDKPFALVGVNVDEKPVLDQLVQDKTVTWPNWHDGPEGPILEKWQVQNFPTAFILDEAGQIRYRDVAGFQLRGTVEMLLAEKEFPLPRNVIPSGTPWQYRSAAGIGQNWNQAEFSAAEWSTGKSPLGYGWNDEATRLENDAKTIVFRKQFAIDDPAKMADLVGELFIDDAAVVWLNGKEVLRTNLASDANMDSPAVTPNFLHGRDARFFAIDPSHLVEGTNTLAVEVHQHAIADADFRFDLALSSNVLPQLKETLKLIGTPKIRRAVTILGGLQTTAESCVKDLTALIAKADLDLQIRVLRSLARIAPEKRLPRLPKPESETEDQNRAQYGYSITSAALETILTPGLSPQDYELARANFEVGKHLLTTFPALIEIKGLLEYRMGEYQKAATTVQGGVLFRNPMNPTKFACLAMSQFQLGEKEKADETMKLLREMLDKPAWGRDMQGYDLLQEAEALLKK